ncbi:hypothetical protein Sjap_001996 [Stephania japonica]|uniref:Uncharacterized protein n=1 Tax=Stephania japonica TaxID=461633 RepID=A0AAP0KL72_9MAGN
MGEKWRKVDDEEDDDEVHLNIQEGSAQSYVGHVVVSRTGNMTTICKVVLPTESLARCPRQRIRCAANCFFYNQDLRRGFQQFLTKINSKGSHHDTNRGGAVPALVQLVSSSGHAAMSSSFSQTTSQDDKIHKSTTSSTL